MMSTNVVYKFSCPHCNTPYQIDSNYYTCRYVQCDCGEYRWELIENSIKEYDLKQLKKEKREVDLATQTSTVYAKDQEINTLKQQVQQLEDYNKNLERYKNHYELEYSLKHGQTYY